MHADALVGRVLLVMVQSVSGLDALALGADHRLLSPHVGAALGEAARGIASLLIAKSWNGVLIATVLGRGALGGRARRCPRGLEGHVGIEWWARHDVVLVAVRLFVLQMIGEGVYDVLKKPSIVAWSVSKGS